MGEHKRYTIISNIGRIIAINTCGGIYTDIDFLNPDYDKKIPVSMYEVLRVFEHCSTIDFYLSTADMKDRTVIENQCMLLSPEKIGMLTPLLNEMAEKLTSHSAEILKEAQQYAILMRNPITKSLNRSTFRGDLLMAYKSKDYSAFCNVNKEIYKDQTLKET